MKMKVLDHGTLLALNRSSMQAGRRQNLRPYHLPARPQDRYWVNAHMTRERDGQREVRVCVVLRIFGGQTAWLDITPEEFAAIPKVDLPVAEWEPAMCAGNPPPAP